MTGPEKFDFIVIGGGSAGYAAARTARRLVDRVAIIDSAESLGGLCILRGCMPSKTLIYSAEVLHLAQQAERFGLSIPEATVDMPALHRRKRRVIGEFANYRQQQLASDRFTFIRAKARFSGPDTLTLSNGSKLCADRFLIATGSRVAVPPVPGLAECGCWTSDDILDLATLPESVLVLGGGVVACELAQFMQRVGCRTTLVQRSPRILRENSPEAAAVVEQALRDDGMEVFTNTELQRVEPTPGGFRAVFKHRGETVERGAQKLVNALGREPATADLGLDAAGVETEASGHIHTLDCQQTSNPRIYAAGDAAGPFEIVHIAILQGEVAARHAFGQPAEAVNYDTRLAVIFTDPQVAQAGLSAAELEARDIPFVSAEYPFDDHGKSILMEAKAGYVKVFAATPGGRVLGAECVGKDASELIHALAVGIALGATVHDLLKAHWYHPTLSEIWTYPLEDCADALESPAAGL